jgi:hypothetical protein
MLGGLGRQGLPECKAPAGLPTSGTGSVARIAASAQLVVAYSRDGSAYVWDGSGLRGSSPAAHTLSQPGGVSRVEDGPGDSAMLVWDSKGALAVRSSPYDLPWPVQQPPPGVSVVQVCALKPLRFRFAAVLSDGSVQVGGWMGCSRDDGRRAPSLLCSLGLPACLTICLPEWREPWWAGRAWSKVHQLQRQGWRTSRRAHVASD